MASSHTLNERPVAPQSRPRKVEPRARRGVGVPEPSTLSHSWWHVSFSFHWVCFWLFIGGLAWIPFWYGSAELGTWGVNAVFFAGLLAIYELFLIVKNQPHPVAARHLWLPALLFLAVVSFIVVQSASWTPVSWHHPIWAMTAELLKQPVESSITVNRNATALALIRLLTAASVFWLAAQLCRHTMRASYFMTAMILIILAYAAYGLIEFSMRPTQVTKLNQYATSTFVNHNHFAAYVGIGLVIVLGLLLRIYQRHVDDYASLRNSFAAFLEASVHEAALLLVSGFVLSVALLLTGSRGAIVATACGGLALATLGLGRRGGTGRRSLILFGVGLAAAIMLFFGDNLFNKISQGGVTDENRLAVYIITLRSILDAPLWGYGYGTFADVFPMFRDRSLSIFGSWEQAHNSYLEIYQGLGLIVGSFFLLMLWLLVAKCLQGAVRRQENMVPAIATSAAVLLGIHSLVEFSLQIQAITLTFVAILGAGIAQSSGSRIALHD